jgi:hypothetical protein
MSGAARPEPVAPPPARAREPAGPLPATLGEPALLDLARGPLPPRAPPAPAAEARPGEAPPPPEPRPLTLAELQAALAEAQGAGTDESDDEGEQSPEAEDGRAAATPAEPPGAADAELEREYFGVALAEPELVFDRARVALEDLALLGSMRRPLPDQGWAGRAEAERRLLARLDAIAACGGDVLPRLIALLDDRPVPDPELTWALVFLLGSLTGADAANEAMRLAGSAALDADGMAEALADALSLAPHPALTPALVPWLSDAAPERRAIAVRALSRRGALGTPQASAATADRDAGVVAAAAAALATSAGPLESSLLARLARHADEAVVAAALETALIRRSEVGLRRARELVAEGRPEHAGAAWLVGVAGTAEDLGLLRGAAAAGSAAAVGALGWHGHPEAVSDLLAMLEGDLAPAALDALQRITAATLTEADPEPRYEEGSEPFAASEGPVPDPVPLVLDPGPWRAWWKEHGTRIRPGTRCRFGHAWSPADDVNELEAPLSVPRIRRLAHLELCARTAGGAPLDLDAFVARQRRQLAAWGEIAARSARGASGGWPVRPGR